MKLLNFGFCLGLVATLGASPMAASQETVERVSGGSTESSDPFDEMEDPATFDLVLRLRLPEDVIAFTHSGQLEPSIPYLPKGIPKLAEPKLNGGIIVMGKLRDPSGEIVAFGTQHSAIPLSREGGVAKFEWPSEWTVTMPGRGTLFLSEIEVPGRVFEIFQRYGKAKAVWTGNMQVRTTSGPTARGNGYVVGGTGEFLGKTGMFVEVNTFRKNDFSKPGQLPEGTIEVWVRFN